MPTLTNQLPVFHKILFNVACMLLLPVSNAIASPVVTGTQISWPDDGWYQVQTADGTQTLCNGGRSCDVNPGVYLVINHSTGERFNNIEVAANNSTGVTVNDNQISWPDDGWYQVQTADGSQTICNGGRFCDVNPGSYLVINHTTGERFNNVTVGSEGNTDVNVSGNQISWPDDGWYQVQTADGSQTLCNGGSSCEVSPGVYVVINHSTGERFNNIEVGADDQNKVRVDFDITVPAYMPSDELQLELVWGDINLNASWVGDEFWSASADFPINTEHTLNVTFYDKNGDIELARSSQEYKTGANATEMFSIGADQFDASLFDADGDGVSNFDELIAGSDPTIVDESTLLEIKEGFNDINGRRIPGFIRRYSSLFEPSIPDDRPYFKDEEVITENLDYAESWGILYDRHTTTIDIDLSGNATFSDINVVTDDPANSTSITQTGTRTNNDSSIHWSGIYTRWSGQASCYTDRSNFTTETSKLDDGRFKQVGVHNHNGRCSSSDPNFKYSYTLTGSPTDDPNYCEPLFGTITSKSNGGIGTDSSWEIIISKSEEDRHWKVSQLVLGEQVEENYLLDELDMSFYCGFVEL